LQGFSKNSRQEEIMRWFLLAATILLAFFSPALGKKVDEKACLEAFNGLAEIIAKNLDKSYGELTKKEQEDFRKYYDCFAYHWRCIDFILDRMNIPHSRFDWWCTWRVARDPLCKIKKNRFALILFPGDRPEGSVIKKIYGNSLDVKIFWTVRAPGIDPDKILKKLEKERKKKFCYVWFDVNRHIVSCPPFHLEKDFLPIVENNCEKVVNGKICCEFYEFVRNVILWMNKEFGKNGRNIISMGAVEVSGQ